MEIVIDFQGFKDNNNEFIIKELAVRPLNRKFAIHKIVLPPFEYETLDYEKRKEVQWLYLFYHGLQWDSGSEPYDTMLYELKELCYFCKKIYVKGEEKAHFLRALLQREVIELGALGCPSVKELSSEYLCVFHREKKNNNYVCALDNAYKLKTWILGNK